MDPSAAGPRKRLTLCAMLLFPLFGAGCQMGDYNFNGKEMLKTFLENDNSEPRTDREKMEDHNSSEWLRHYHDPSYNPEYQDFMGFPTESPPDISPMLRDLP